MRRLAVFVFAASTVMATNASAQQLLNFSFGGFNLGGGQNANGVVTGRGDDDVLVADSDFRDGRPGFLDFNFKDFRGATISAEYVFGMGDNFEGGLGIGFYQRTVLAADHFSEFENTGDPILADLKLRIVPFNATFRWLPIGHRNGVIPYVGGGVGV